MERSDRLLSRESNGRGRFVFLNSVCGVALASHLITADPGSASRGNVHSSASLSFVGPPRVRGAALSNSIRRHDFTPRTRGCKNYSPNQYSSLFASTIAVCTFLRLATGRLTLRHRQKSRTALASTLGWFRQFKDAIFGRQKGRIISPDFNVASVGGTSVVTTLVVSSSQPCGQPFCGEYEGQGYSVNGRPVYKKLEIPASNQAVYLLYNSANQWIFTPHRDGRADGWGFAPDTAKTPMEIQRPFDIWDGRVWIPDGTLEVRNKADGRGGRDALVAKEESGATQLPTDVDHRAADSEQEVQSTYEPPEIPQEMATLGNIHWTTMWEHQQRCLIEWGPSPAGLSEKPLVPHAGIKRGALPNGLRYVMLKNAMPPGRFEAHIELHVGSVDEEPHEQGIAHMMEHVCFLGSQKRERLIGTGCRSNALTDFQHTIYHVHSPVKQEDGRNMYIPVLEALNEMAFAPKMSPQRIEKERKAVLAEMQQVNDMEYRIETWTLSGLHANSKLGSQFPIGKEEQIRAWQQKDLKAFHKKWYFPGNATLYVVGDLEEEEILSGLTKVFAPTPARKGIRNTDAVLEPVWGEGSEDPRSLFRRKLEAKRTELLHNFSLPMVGTKDSYTSAAAFDVSDGESPYPGPIRIFRNELLDGVQLNFYAKVPVRPLRTLEDIRHLIAIRILVGVLQFRIVSRYSSNHAPVQVDHSDSFREGCAVTSVTVNADARDWRTGLACVIQEVRALCDFGITENELNRYMTAMLKDVEKGFAENETVPSEDHLNFIMTSDVFNHVVMDPEQSYAAFNEVAPHVTVEEVNVASKWMLGFFGYYGKAMAPPTTAIVVCTPTQVHQEQDESWLPFHITEDEVVDVLLSVPDKADAGALDQVDVPESLLKDQLDKWLENHPVDKITAWRLCSRKVDRETGITQLLLPNGAKVNYACTTNESQGSMRLLVPGGRSTDSPDDGGAAMVGIRALSESGAVSNFSREQIELFAVSNMISVHLDLNLEFSYIDANFSTNDNGLVASLELLHLLFLEPRWELPAFVRAQQAFKAQAGAAQKSLEQGTMDRLMQAMYENDVKVCEPTVEDLSKLTLAKVRKAIASQLRPQDVEINLVGDFEGIGRQKITSAHVEGSLSTGKHHQETADDHQDVLNVPEAARERKLKELDESLWKYLGSIPVTDVESTVSNGTFVKSGGLEITSKATERSAHLEDDEERAIANIGGGAPNRWGKGDSFHQACMEKKTFSWDLTKNKMNNHPLYPSMCLLVLREVLNTRLFSTVRDSLGLSYDCSFDLSLLDRLEAGWYSCTVSAHPSRIKEAVDATKGVLQSAHKRPINDFEIATARRTLLRRHETDLQTNEYWISLLTHLQLDGPKDVSCIRDVEPVLSSLTWIDVQNAYNTLLTDSDQLFVSVTTAGPGLSFISGGVAPASVSTRVLQKKQLIEID